MYRLVMDSITPEMLNKENYYWIINHVESSAKLNDLRTFANILDEVLELQDLPDDFRKSAIECKGQVVEQIRKKELQS